MIKSEREMKNNSLHYGNLLKPPIKSHICECLSNISNSSERKNTPFEGFEHQSKEEL